VELEEAAYALGAEEVQRFLFVTVPALMPGILTGAIMIFIFGITDFLVSLILGDNLEPDPSCAALWESGGDPRGSVQSADGLRFLAKVPD
jgi:ABC-type sulfate transport system permease component